MHGWMENQKNNSVDPDQNAASDQGNTVCIQYRFVFMKCDNDKNLQEFLYWN